MRSVHARAVGIKEQLTIVWGFRPLAEGLLYMMSRVVDVVEGEGEGAKSCAELNLLSSHNTRIIDFAHITVPYALNGHCRKNARNVTIGSSKYPMATESDEQSPSVLNEFLFRSLRET